METQNYTGTLYVLSCANCQMHFGIPADFQVRRLADGKGFYCPAGHENVYRESDVKRLERQLAAKQAKIDQALADAAYQKEMKERAERRTSAARGLLAKTKNRIANGVCPCCKRYFENLHRHISGQHPEYTTKD